MKNNILIFVLTVGMSPGLVSCADFLEKTNPSKILSDEWFYDETSLSTYANGFQNSYTPSVASLTYGDADADYLARRNQSNFFTGSWTPNEQGGWSTSDWHGIYNVNYYLKHMRETENVDEETLNHYEGVGRFWRAWLYFGKVMTFGAVPWYSEPIDPEDEEGLYKTQDSREYVMHKILEDLNYAAEHCSVSARFVNQGVINGYIANAFKARVCLYEGTYRKYHKVDPSTQQAWTNTYETSEDFLNECVKACSVVMNSGTYRIINSAANINTQYRALFTNETLDYTEVLWFREYIQGVVMHPTTWYFNSSTAGACWSMDKDFLNTYLNRDGTRYTDTPNYISNNYITELSSTRDARIAQTIITPGFQKRQDGVWAPFVPNFQITRTGYQVIKYNIDDDAYEGTTVSYNSIPVMRYAEVLLNYAEAKAELGQFTTEDWNLTIAPLRARSGVATTVPATADSYLINYFDNTVTDMWLLEIRRERGIELFMENLRYQDLMRWHLGHLIEKPWRGIYCPLGTSQALNTDNSRFVSIVQAVATEAPNTQYLVLSDNISLDSDNCLVVQDRQRIWEEKMYLRPIPQTAIDVNANLKQNELWK